MRTAVNDAKVTFCYDCWLKIEVNAAIFHQTKLFFEFIMYSKWFQLFANVFISDNQYIEVESLSSSCFCGGCCTVILLPTHAAMVSEREEVFKPKMNSAV